MDVIVGDMPERHQRAQPSGAIDEIDEGRMVVAAVRSGHFFGGDAVVFAHGRQLRIGAAAADEGGVEMGKIGFQLCRVVAFGIVMPPVPLKL